VIENFQLNFEPEFVSNILQLRERVPTKKRSNKGGWQSPFYTMNMLPWAISTVQQIKDLAQHQGEVTYWFNVNGPGNFNEWHDHGDFGKRKSGCLYLQVPMSSGAIEFKRPPLVVDPNEGMLLIFPDNAKHRVLANKSNDSRITMAFNLWKM
jgi:hypothetical protein